jgi:hypothetical protein
MQSDWRGGNVLWAMIPTWLVRMNQDFKKLLVMEKGVFATGFEQFAPEMFGFRKASL